ncbi:MAG: hypothetical protein ACQET7_11640 [Thermodesulfobacteriota bacterium]
MDLPAVEHRLALTVETPALAFFTPLLMEGVELEADLGCSVRALLCDQLGLDSEYVNERIQTVFLDGRPVDRLDHAVVTDGSVLALSAALPGLLGATLRKDGVYASLRQGITHVESPAACGKGRGLVTIKAFNVLLRELAPALFQSGVLIGWKRLEKRIQKGGDRLIEAVHVAEIDGMPVPPKDLAALARPPESRVLFSLSID